MEVRIIRKDELMHFGVLGMHWGVRRYQPYSTTGPRQSGKSGIEIGDAASYGQARAAKKLDRGYHKLGKMSKEEYAYAQKLYNSNKEANLPGSLKERIYESFDNNLSDDEKTRAIVEDEYGDYKYTAINLGHNQYKIIHGKRIDSNSKVDHIINEVLKEVVGENWEDYDE